MANYNSTHTGAQIDSAVTKALNPDSTPTQSSSNLITSGGVKAAIENFVRPNLLDNAFFLGGLFPINQRAQTSYSSAGYGIDRWTSTRANTITINPSAGLTLNYSTGQSYQQIVQLVKNYKPLIGKTVTFSAKLSNTARCVLRIVSDSESLGSVTTINANSNGVFSVTGVIPSSATLVAVSIGSTTDSPTSGGFTVQAAKLEIGNTQTLAHQESGVWVLNEMPSFEVEYDKCQRYLWCGKPTSYVSCAFAFASDANICVFTLPLPQDMAADATQATIIGTAPRIYNTGNTQITDFTLAATVYKNILQLTATKTGGFTAGAMYRLLLNSNALFGISLEP